MATTQYIGSRYVPLLADPVEWSSTKAYEPLTIVTHEGNSYTSRQFVPVGIDIDNEEFWALTGNYNAQIEQYRREVLAISTDTTRMLSFDTVSDMQNATNILAGMTCHTNGFHTIGDGGAAYYIIGTSGTANDTDMFALRDGLFATLVLTEHYVTPEMFGAYGDGRHNDYAALARAMQLHSSDVRVEKTYLVSNSVLVHGRYYVFELPKALNMSGKGTILFPPNSEDGLSLFYCDGEYLFSDFTVDMNGANNLVPSGMTWPMIAFFGNFANSIIDGITIKNSAGRNMIVMNGAGNNVVQNCKLIDGGTTLRNNNNQNDFTYLYVNSKNTDVHDCLITSANNPFTYCGGIEMHQSDITVHDCVIENCYPAIYIVAVSSETILNENACIRNNRIRNCHRGIDIIYANTIKKVKIVANTIECKTLGFSGVTRCIGTSTSSPNQSAVLDDVLIQENTIINESSAAANNAIAISLADADNVRILDNYIYGRDYCFNLTGREGLLDIERNIVDSDSTITNALLVITHADECIWKNNINLSDMYVVNGYTIFDKADIECKYAEIRPLAGIYKTGWFTTTDFFTVGDYINCSIKKHLLTMYRDITIGSAFSYFSTGFTAQGTLIGIQCTPYGSSAHHEVTIGAKGSDGCQIKTTADDVTALLKYEFSI